MKRKIFIVVITLILTVCFTNISTFADTKYHETFARHVVQFILNKDQIPEGADENYFFNLLEKHGIQPEGGFQKGKKMDIEESILLLGMALADNHTSNKLLEKSQISNYLNRATIIGLQGDVYVKSFSKDEWQKAELNMQLSQSEKIKTGRNSYAQLKVGISGYALLKENSLLDITKMMLKSDGMHENIHLHLDEGRMLINVQGKDKKSSFNTSIPSTLVAVRGTIYEIGVD